MTRGVGITCHASATQMAGLSTSDTRMGRLSHVVHCRLLFLRSTHVQSACHVPGQSSVRPGSTSVRRGEKRSGVLVDRKGEILDRKEERHGSFKNTKRILSKRQEERHCTGVNNSVTTRPKI